MSDMVKVIYCEDCKYFDRQGNSYGYCYYWDYEQGSSPNTVGNDDYCSNGREKEK